MRKPELRRALTPALFRFAGEGDCARVRSREHYGRSAGEGDGARWARGSSWAFKVDAVGEGGRSDRAPLGAGDVDREAAANSIHPAASRPA